jgi:hypothetical protein
MASSSAQGPIWYDAQFYPDSQAGYVYIIRLDRPYIAGVKRVRIGGHYERGADGKRRLVGGEIQERPQMVYAYLGWSPHPWKRYDQHMRGRGARILAYLAEIGVSMTLAAVAPGGRDLEARLKKRHNNRALLKFC